MSAKYSLAVIVCHDRWEKGTGRSMNFNELLIPKDGGLSFGTAGKTLNVHGFASVRLLNSFGTEWKV